MININKFKQEHLARTRDWINNPEISLPFGMDRFISTKEHLQWFSHIQKDLTQYIWAIDMLKYGHIGNVGLKNIDTRNRRAEFWIYIGEKAFWGKGVAKQATMQALQFCFDKLNLRKIYLHVATDNIRALKLYTGCGFVQEGLLEDELETSNGTSSLIRMACLEQRWRKQYDLGPRVALMQPTFLSWLGYYELLDKVDLFVFLDDFQFSRQGYGQRNRLLFSSEKASIVTLPIRHPQNLQATFRDIQPVYNELWKKKFLKALLYNYGKTNYFSIVYPLVEEWLNTSYNDLAHMLTCFTKKIGKRLGITTQIAYSSDIAYNRGLARSECIASLLELTKARIYYSPIGSLNYMREDGIFPLKNVPTYFQNHIPLAYTQNGRESFVPYLSVLDALFNLSPSQLRPIMRATQSWLSWEEAIDLSTVNFKQL